jgi:hypothetical protein
MGTVNFPPDAEVGGLPILTPANLPNYINQGYIIPPFTTGNTYSKLCSLTFSGNDAIVTMQFKLISTENWIDYNAQYAEINVKAGIRGDVSTGVKSCHINCVSSKAFNPANIIGVVTENDSSGYAVDIYLNQVNSAGGSRKYFLLPIFTKVNIPKVTKVQFYNNLASIASLPAGTQIVCDGGSRDIISVKLFYTTVWNVQDLNYNNLANIVDIETGQYLYGTPTWDIDGLIFPSTSIIMNTTTQLLNVSSGYIDSTHLAYEPVIVQGTAKKIRFFNRSTSAMVSAVDTNMSCQLTFSRLR